jgi:uncharacterized membrane protein YhaH (DUF805 family)
LGCEGWGKNATNDTQKLTIFLIINLLIMNYFLKALRKYAEFNGRASRSEFWYFFLVYMLIGVGLDLFGEYTNNPTLSLIFTFVTLVPNIAVSFRRMHDIDKNGWYSLIPIYGLLLACIEGTKGPNRYGEDPLSKDEDYLPQTGILDDEV